MKQRDIRVIGRKGGGESDPPPPPVEEPNTLQSKSTAELVDLLCEGEISGPATGDSWYKSTYFNETVVQTVAGTLNFSGVTIDARTGTPDQEYMPGFDEIEAETGVSLNVSFSSPVSQTITDSDTEDVNVTLGTPTLFIQEDDGDIRKTRIDYRITVTPFGGAEQTALTSSLEGKTTSVYQKQHLIKTLSNYGSAPWTIKVYRLTADSTSLKLQNGLTWYSYTEVKNVKIRYMDSVVVGLTINSQEFGNSVPYRAYKIKGRKISYPNNLDPETRVYTGVWDGTFTTGYCNNPAWVLYDMLTNNRFGIGLDADQVDKWTLYTVGVYCDQDVTFTEKTRNADGTYTSTSVTEPRFTFNGVIQNRAEALEIIAHLSSVFRGFPIWFTGQVSVIQDAPKTISRIASPANVNEGTFEYEGSPKTQRHTAVKVSYNDPLNFGKLETVILEDEEAIVRYGYNPLDVVAFGCNSRNEAIRRGKYILYTDINQTELCKFRGGIEWGDALPGDLIGIQDEHYANIQLSGRVRSSTYFPATVTIDRDIEIESGVTYTLLVETASGAAVERTLTNAPGIWDVLSFTEPITGGIPQYDFMWAVSTTNVAVREFMIMKIDEYEIGEYEIAATQYDSNKYAIVEDGLVIEPPSTLNIPTGKLDPPSTIAIQPYTYTESDQSVRKYAMVISWVASPDPRTDDYEIRYRFNPDANVGGWRRIDTTAQLFYDWVDVTSGTYDIGVRARGITGTSNWVTYDDFILNTSVGGAEAPTDLQVKGGGTVFDGPDCQIEWTSSTGTTYSSGAVPSASVGDSNVKNYKINVMKIDDTLLRTAFTESKYELEYVYTKAMNAEDNSNVPVRDLKFRVWTNDFYDDLSATYAQLIASNPVPDMSGTTPTVTPIFTGMKVDWKNIAIIDNDLSKYIVLLDTSNPPTTEVAEVSAKTTYWVEPDLTPETTYFAKIVPYDDFGIGIASNVNSTEPLKINADDIDGALIDRLTYTDSLGTSGSILASLYDHVTSSGNGIKYYSGYWIKTTFPTGQILDRVSLWADSSVACYVSTSIDDATWTYYKAEGDHTLDSEGRLIEATNEADAITNWWNANAGDGIINIALFPEGLVFNYARLHFLSNNKEVYELVWTDQVIAEWIVANSLSAISADLGTIAAGTLQSTNWGAGQGQFFDLDNDTIQLGGSTAPKFDWDGVAGTLEIDAVVTIGPGSTGYDDLVDKPGSLIEISPGEYNWLVDPTININAGITTVDGGKITTGSITANQIAANTITGNEIAASTITAAKLSVTQLSAITANLGSITAGNITLNSTGYIRGGQTAYNTGTGFWLGYSSGYKFSIGNPATKYMTWDGSALTIRGTLNASDLTAGTINASVIGVTNLNASNITTGTMSGTRITAGTLNADRIVANTITAEKIIGGQVTQTALAENAAYTGSFTAKTSVLSTTVQSDKGGTFKVQAGADFYGSISNGQAQYYLEVNGVQKRQSSVMPWGNAIQGNGTRYGGNTMFVAFSTSAGVNYTINLKADVVYYAGSIQCYNRFITVTEFKR